MILTNGSQKTEKLLSKIETLFEKYVKEMRFLNNFSERTLVGYREVFNRWKKYADGIPTEEKLTDYVVGMRQAGLSPVTCNISIRATNAFLTWLGKKGVISAELRLKRMPEEKKKMRVFPDEEIEAILSVKPKGVNEQQRIKRAPAQIISSLRILYLSARDIAIVTSTVTFSAAELPATDFA